MKTFLLPIVCLITICSSSQGQFLKVGTTSGALTYEQLYNGSPPFALTYTSIPHPGIIAAIGNQFELSSFVSIQAEVAYSQTRGTISVTSFSDDPYVNTQEITTDFVGIGVFPRLTYSSSGISLYELTGPQLELELAKKDPVETPTITKVGLILGAGIESDVVSPVIVGLEFRYHPLKPTLTDNPPRGLSELLKREPLLEFALTFRRQ